jgi:hypothetical protein
MDSVTPPPLDAIPRVTPEIARRFDADHGVPDELYVDAMLRLLKYSNPDYLDELEKIANKEWEQHGFEAKVHFLEGAMIATGLLARQGSTDTLRAIFNLSDTEEDPELINASEIITSRHEQDIEQPEPRKRRFSLLRRSNREQDETPKKPHGGIAAAFVITLFNR